MSALRRKLHDYLTVRRALGRKLERAGKLLPDFLDYLASIGETHVTSATAVAWACQPRNVHPAWWTSRLVIVRGFAKYLHTLDPRHEVPPLGLLPHRRARTKPYVYSDADLIALLTATETLQSAMKAITYKTLLALLAVTGLRVGEAIALDEADVDRRGGTLLVRKTKFGKTREVPLHPTTVKALASYAQQRDRLLPRRRCPSFFVSTAGTRLFYQNVQETFMVLVYAAGLGVCRPRRPRIHDLRHTFAIRTVLGWYRAGEDVEARLPVLSTYLGHVGPSATYWYLSAVPELLHEATLRLERASKGRP